MDQTTDYSNLIKQLEAVSQHPPQDAETRRRIAAALRGAQAAFESPLDSIHRIAYSPLQLVVAKIAVDMNVFQFLSKASPESPISIEAIAEGTSTPLPFLARILRFLAASNMLLQPTPTTYAPNGTTRSLAHPGFSAAIQHHFQVQLPVWSELPTFLASRSFQPPSSASDTPFQIAHSTSLPAFQYAATKPQLIADFSQWMAAQRQGEETFLKVMSHLDVLGAEPHPERNERALFVDVGGSIGHQCRALRAWLPKETSPKIVLQDLPPVIARVGEIEGVQVMAHDFWGEQPVKGATFYYLRNVLHDYGNEACKVILQHIKNAMLPDSKILLDELVLPDRISEPSADAETNASLDILLMASLGGQERTKAEWDELLEGVGLAVKEIRMYDHRGHSVLIVEHKR